MDGAATLCAEILKVLAQPTRLRILDFLRNGERNVFEIYHGIGEEQSNTSRHLTIMLAHRVLVQRRDGMRIYYGIKHAEVLAIVDLVSNIIDLEFPAQGSRDAKHK